MPPRRCIPRPIRPLTLLTLLLLASMGIQCEETRQVNPKSEADWLRANLPYFMRARRRVPTMDPEDPLLAIAPNLTGAVLLLDVLKSRPAEKPGKDTHLWCVAMSLCALGSRGVRNKEGDIARLRLAVQSGIKQLLAVQDKDGCFSLKEENGLFHALATLAVASWVSRDSPELEKPLRLATGQMTKLFLAKDGGFSIKPNASHSDAVTTYFSLFASRKVALRTELVGLSHEVCRKTHDFSAALRDEDGLYAIAHGVKPSYWGTVANLGVGHSFDPNLDVQVLRELSMAQQPFAFAMRYLLFPGTFVPDYSRQAMDELFELVSDMPPDAKRDPELVWSVACYVWILGSMYRMY